MQLLTIETTGASASVALSDQEGNRILEISSERMNHLQNLMTMIQSVLKKRSLQISDVTAIAVSEGPGSFTGIRIGVSAARALAQALSLPVIPVPTLQSFVYQEPSGRISSFLPSLMPGGARFMPVLTDWRIRQKRKNIHPMGESCR